MPEYRRNRVPGATLFFTVNLLDRSSRLLTDRIDALRNAVRSTRARAPFHIDAWVVLPEHMHRVWTLPPDDDDDYARHVDYVHFNPVKHGWVAEPAAWPYWTFHRAVAAGWYPVGWDGRSFPGDEWGERR